MGRSYLPTSAEEELRRAELGEGFSWWLSGKESACQCRRPRFDLWDGKTLWRRKWQSASVFLPGKSHGQRNLVGYSPWGCRVGHNLLTNQQQNKGLGGRDELAENGRCSGQ